uniref:Uncharacterized protein n=1 Tax=Globisporangium ultimum (strain ATCC 200006 / CBS 805.95 / DAOM BR144) TaxID=431595 RepID=K3X784_GLOUD
MMLPCFDKAKLELKCSVTRSDASYMEILHIHLRGGSSNHFRARQQILTSKSSIAEQVEPT